MALLVAAAASAELYSPRSQRLQDGFGGELEGLAFELDQFGAVQVAGDFNGDGRDDLAISDFESLTQQREGALHVIYGTAAGLSTSTDQLIQDFDPATGLPDREMGDEFAAALAVGDFNSDGFDDLAIGAPREDFGFEEDAGAFTVLFGSAAGLVTLGSPAPRRFRRDDVVFGNFDLHDGDRFASALAAGDWDDDGFDDLAIGCPLCDAITFDLPANSGGVSFLRGSAAGLVAAPQFRRYVDQDMSDPDGGAQMPNSCEVDDHFGASLATGDFDDDGVDDLAIGAPGETLGAQTAAGAVHVLYGEVGVGVRISGSQFWRESIVLTGGDEGAFDRWGESLVAGDVTGDGVDDLVVGAPREDVGALVDAGAVTLLWGQPGVGIDTPGSEIFDQGSFGDGQSPGAGELFGRALAVGDFVDRNAAGAADLAIGIPQETVFDPVTLLSLPLAGAVVVVPGGFGLDPTGVRYWFLGARGGAGSADLDADTLYGFSLAAGDFDGDGSDDLSIGAIEVEGVSAGGEESSEAGAVFVLFGALFADGFGSGDRTSWSASAP